MPRRCKNRAVSAPLDLGVAASGKIVTLLAQAAKVTHPVVSFGYCPGVDRVPAEAHVDLCGSWGADGIPSPESWSRHPMTRSRDESGAVCFTAAVSFDQQAAGVQLAWGTWLRLGAAAPEVWGIAAEVPDLTSTAQVRSLSVAPASRRRQQETYRLSGHRLRGAQR